MKRNFLYLLLLFAFPAISGCSAIGTIFKAGMSWAFFLVFIAIVVILWLVFRGKK
ncbi:MAG: phosphatidate cytidylyltransferase [Ferruginibacter sp.]